MNYTTRKTSGNIMKRVSFLLAAAFCIAFMNESAKAQVPTLYYDFENNTTRTTFENSVEQAINSGSGALTKVGGSGAQLTITGVAGAGTFNGGGANGQAITTSGGGWDASTTDPGTGAGFYYQFVVNTTGFSQLSISLDNQASATGPARIGVLYSTDGTNFTASTTALTGNAAFSAAAFDLSGVTAINNQSSVTIRLYAFAGSAADRTGRSAFAGGGTFRIDNLTVLAKAATATKTLLNYPSIGLSIRSGTAFTPTYSNFDVNGSGITVSLASALVLNGTATVTSGTLATGANTLSINTPGTLTVTGSLQIDQGGFPGGTGTYSYNATTGTLIYNNSSGTYGVNNDPYWPTTNGPQNVNVKGAGGIQMNVARTVGLLFQYAAGVNGAGNLTLNGTSQVNTGGFTSGSPTYGASSLLKYNVNASYGRNGEWLPGATSGAGYPANVQLSNNTNLDLPNGSTTQPFQMSGNLTIDSGSTLAMTPLTQPLVVLGSVSINGALTLSGVTGGDIKVGGNWTRSGTFTPNGRAVIFNGAGTQTVTRSPAASESFDYLIVDKASGNLTLSSSPATGALVNGSSGNVLQLVNSGGIDLNGQTLVMQNSGGNILTSGGARTVTGASGSNFTFTGAKTVTSSGGGALVFDTNVNVSLLIGVDFGASLSTINGSLSLNSGGFVNTNAPTYGPSSTLIYDCACTFHRGAEWSATSGPGYPNNVAVNSAGSGTDLDLAGTAPGVARRAAGKLTVNNGGNLLMDFVGAGGSPMTAALTVVGDVLVQSGGGMHLSTISGGDLKVEGFNFTVNGTWVPNNRAVFFEGGNAQNVNAASSPLSLPYVVINKGGQTVRLNVDVTALAPAGGNSVSFNSPSSSLTLNGRTLTLGGTVSGGALPAAGFGGDSSSNMVLQDGGAPGAMGTLTFVNGGQSLNGLTINRTGASGSATLGSDLTVGGALNLTAGDINTGSFTLTHNGTPAGTTDVVGNVRRTDLGSTARSFGNPNNQISFQTGTAPTELTVNLVKNVPTGAGFGYPGAVKRTYTITPTGGGGYTATLRLHYNDSDLNGNTEALLDFWRFNGASWNRIIKTLADPVIDNWIQTSGVTQFSPWTLAQGTPLTQAKLVEFKATQYDASTALEWKTGYEVDNLGFNVYREAAGRRTLVNTSLIAGSALVAGQGVALTAGNSYPWPDASGAANARYWLEQIDLEGKTTLHGPYAATRVAA